MLTESRKGREQKGKRAERKESRKGREQKAKQSKAHQHTRLTGADWSSTVAQQRIQHRSTRSAATTRA
jgi:hypothetical protein